MSDQPFRLPGHGFIGEPELKFHPERDADLHTYPLKGLSQFGPYSRSVLGTVSDPIRVAVISPADGLAHVQSILGELERRHTPTDRAAYLIDFKGFASTFGVRVAYSNIHVEITSAVDKEMAASERPHLVLADHLTRSVAALKNSRSSFDVVTIYLPERWRPHTEAQKMILIFTITSKA